MSDIAVMGSILNVVGGFINSYPHTENFVNANGKLVVCLGAQGPTHFGGFDPQGNKTWHIGWHVSSKLAFDGFRSGFVFIDSLPVASVGTPASCGHVVVTGEEFVQINEGE